MEREMTFDELRIYNLQEKGLLPNPRKYPDASKENRMENQFGQEDPQQVVEMQPNIEYALLSQ